MSTNMPGREPKHDEITLDSAAQGSFDIPAKVVKIELRALEDGKDFVIAWNDSGAIAAGRGFPVKDGDIHFEDEINTSAATLYVQSDDFAVSIRLKYWIG